MPIPFIVAGAAIFGGAAAGVGAAAAATAGLTAAEVVGAAVASGIAAEMLSDDDKPKNKTSSDGKKKISRSDVPEDVRRQIEGKNQKFSSQLEEFETKGFGYYYGRDGYIKNHFISKGFLQQAAKLGSVSAQNALKNWKFNC